MALLPAPNAANMPPNPYSPPSYSLLPTPYSLKGADAVERWFTEKERNEILAFSNLLMIQK